MGKNIYTVDFIFSENVRYFQTMDILDMEHTLFSSKEYLIELLEEKDFTSIKNESSLFEKVMQRNMVYPVDNTESHITAYIRKINH